MFGFLTLGYSVRVAMSYSWDFLIYMRFCATMLKILQPALHIALFQCPYQHVYTSLMKLVFHFYILLVNNLEFDSGFFMKLV